MAFLLKTNVASHFRSQFQKTGDDLSQSRRRFHIELGAREKALLAEDPALKRFKSHKKGVKMIKGIGYVLTLLVLAGCCYESSVRFSMMEEARKEKGRIEAEAAIERA